MKCICTTGHWYLCPTIFSLFVQFRKNTAATCYFTVIYACIRKVTWSFHALRLDRKSTRLNSSHVSISYAVFCLKKKRGELDAERKRQSRSNEESKYAALLLSARE